MGRYNKYWTRLCTHTSWWLVHGWVTTKEYHLCIRFRNDTLHVISNYNYNYYTPTGNLYIKRPPLFGKSEAAALSAPVSLHCT